VESESTECKSPKFTACEVGVPIKAGMETLIVLYESTKKAGEEFGVQTGVFHQYQIMHCL
jgi:hypothetical protein